MKHDDVSFFYFHYFLFFIAKSTFILCGFLHLMSYIFLRERTIFFMSIEGTCLKLDLFWKQTQFEIEGAGGFFFKHQFQKQ